MLNNDKINRPKNLPLAITICDGKYEVYYTTLEAFLVLNTKTGDCEIFTFNEIEKFLASKHKDK